MQAAGLTWRYANSGELGTLSEFRNLTFEHLFFFFFFLPLLCVSAWKDRPECFQARLRRPFWRVESRNHPGKTAFSTGNPVLLCGSGWSWISAAVRGSPVSPLCFCFQYELATGRFPYPKWNSVFDQLTQVVKGEPPQLSNSEERQFSPKFISFVNLWWGQLHSFHLYADGFLISLSFYLSALLRMNQKGQSTGSFW